MSKEQTEKKEVFHLTWPSLIDWASKETILPICTAIVDAVALQKNAREILCKT